MCVSALQAETSTHSVHPFQFLANSQSSHANGAIGSLTEHEYPSLAATLIAVTLLPSFFLLFYSLRVRLCICLFIA